VPIVGGFPVIYTLTVGEMTAVVFGCIILGFIGGVGLIAFMAFDDAVREKRAQVQDSIRGKD
jgi:hypothetical protein